jgi:hypothetical protein
MNSLRMKVDGDHFLVEYEGAIEIGSIGDMVCLAGGVVAVTEAQAEPTILDVIEARMQEAGRRLYARLEETHASWFRGSGEV